MLSVVAGIAIVALVVCLVDLLLTVAVIRRLREHTSVFERMPSGMQPRMLARGETVDPFEATTTTGELVSRDRLAGETLVGVFTVGCQPCADQLPVFVEYAGRFTGGRDQVIAVVAMSSQDVDTTDYRERLEPVARVVLEPEAHQPGRIGAAFAIGGYPAFGIVDATGRMAASEMRLSELLVTSAA